MLKLNDTWGIRAEDTCCVLVRFKVITGESVKGREVKPENIGKTREEIAGYYANLTQALTAFLEKASREEVVDREADIKEMLNVWERHMDEIRRIR